jgi:clan AA aspartic protease
MGLVYADITLKNPRDESLASMEVRALADTGAMHMCIPQKVAVQLRLETLQDRQVTTADGMTRTVPYVGPLMVGFKNRLSFTGALVMGDEVLLGAIPMEDMDLVVSPANLAITVNPSSPNIPSSVAKGIREETEKTAKSSAVSAETRIAHRVVAVFDYLSDRKNLKDTDQQSAFVIANYFKSMMDQARKDFSENKRFFGNLDSHCPDFNLDNHNIGDALYTGNLTPTRQFIDACKSNGVTMEQLKGLSNHGLMVWEDPSGDANRLPTIRLRLIELLATANQYEPQKKSVAI